MNESLNTRLMFALAGHSYRGLRLKQVAKLVDESSPTTLRGLERMREDGLAEQLQDESKAWRLTPRLIQLAFKHMKELEREDQHFSDFQSRYSRISD